MNKAIPTEQSDFEKLIKSNSRYVDKTEYVYDLVKEKLNNFYFLSRPRGFGKSLMCSTLEYLFKGRRDLFEGLYIAEHTDYDFEEYPVLHFDFSKLRAQTYEQFYISFQRVTAEKIKENGYEVDLNKSPGRMLLDYLEKSNKKSVIIVDEFDSPLINSLDDLEKLENIRSEITYFYNIIKCLGNNIRFLFITGVTKLVNRSIFSGFNNYVDISMNPRFATAFGYTEEELLSNFSEYIDAYLSSEDSPYRNKEDFISDIRDYYDGYRFSDDSDEKVYNPVSVGAFFECGCVFKNYWEIRGISLLALETAKDYGILKLVENGSVTLGSSSIIAFDISEIKESRIRNATIYALLYFTGYLTIEYGNISGFRLKVPNKEISTVFKETLARSYRKDA